MIVVPEAVPLMNTPVSRWEYAALSALLAGDAVASSIPVRYVARQMDALRVPLRLRPLIPVAKAAAALGLAAVFRYPGLARLATAVPALYFAVAVGIRIKMRNRPADVIPSILLLAVVTTMTFRGPHRRA